MQGGNVQDVGVVENGEFLVGSLVDGGQVTLLPSLGGAQVDAEKPRKLNCNIC